MNSSNLGRVPHAALIMRVQLRAQHDGRHNQIWQHEIFDRSTIDRELGEAHWPE